MTTFPKRTAGFVLLLALIATLASAQDRRDWKKELKQQIEASFPPAQMAFMSTNIKKLGEPLLLLQGGVLADRDSYPANDVRGGRVQPQSRSNKLGAFLAQAQDNEARQYQVVLQQYQPIFLTGIGISGDRLTIRIATAGQFLHEGVDRAAIARYATGQSLKGDTLTKTDASARTAALVFDFPRGQLSTLPPAHVIGQIEQVLVRVTDPRAPKFGTVGLGMTRDEVLRNLGKPVNVVVLESEEILVYDKLKVRLRAGKVVDVQ